MADQLSDMITLFNMVLAPATPVRDGAGHVWSFKPRAKRMDNHHRIDVITFVGESTVTMIEAHDRAAVALQAWYAEQVILFTADGASVFAFSTAAYRDGERYVCLITVFDTRHRPS